MKLTESQLRKTIRQVLREDSGSPQALKSAATDVVAALNEENPAAFWASLESALEGLAGIVEIGPNVDRLEKQKFIEAIRPVAKLCNQIRNAYQNKADLGHHRRG